MRRWEKREIRRIARERVEILLSEAGRVSRDDPERARRYVLLALRVARKYRIKIPERFRYRFCRKCGAWWIPGRNLKVRIVPRPKPMIVYVCLDCGAVRRRGYDKQTLGEKG